MPGAEISAGHAAFLQTATAVVQAAVSLSLLAWYVLTAHMERVRTRRERLEDFESLVVLCRDLGVEAKSKTEVHRHEASMIEGASADAAATVSSRLTLWKADMAVIYVCLNEVPHYEVRNPAFSTALTRLWMEVDARAVKLDTFYQPAHLASFLELKLTRIAAEIDAIADLLMEPVSAAPLQRRLVGAAKRRGKVYAASGSIQDDVEYL